MYYRKVRLYCISWGMGTIWKWSMVFPIHKYILEKVTKEVKIVGVTVVETTYYTMAKYLIFTEISF